MQRLWHTARLSRHVGSPWTCHSGARRLGSSAPLIKYGHEQQHHFLDKTSPIHLLRHLLRECTYLPDPLARAYLKDHIAYRFRTYATKDASSSAAVPQTQLSARLREGRKALYSLRRANAGFLPHIKRVLSLTYGRTGRRGRELMEPLKHKGPTRTSASTANPAGIVGQALASHPTVLPQRLLEQIPHMSPPLEQLYREQQRQPRRLDKNGHLGKRLGPDIPLENAYKRSLPAKRVKNIVKRWYADIMGKLLPPLPPHLWSTLEHLARRGPPKDLLRRERRKMVGLEHSDDDEDTLLLLEGLGVSPEEPQLRNGGTQQPHRVTKRFMRRRWDEVLEISPRLDWHDEPKQWRVQWSQKESFPKAKNLTKSVQAAIRADEHDP